VCRDRQRHGYSKFPASFHGNSSAVSQQLCFSANQFVSKADTSLISLFVCRLGTIDKTRLAHGRSSRAA
jgi:hypothetical protein